MTMDPIRLAVAAVLLTAPPGTVELPDAAAVHSACALEARWLALNWEILDKRETTHLLSAGKDFASDLKVLQGRYHELAAAPHLEDLDRLPSRALATDLLAFNRAFRADVEAKLAIDGAHEEELQTTLEETDHLHRIWDAVREARCEYYYITVRRQALQHLRDLIGMEAYYSSNLPPHLPVWRLPESSE
jgi:hypothetical protein